MKKVSNILARKGGNVITIDAETTVLDALRLMDDKNIGSVVVTEQGAYVGLLTERDYARKVILKSRSSHDTAVSDIMSAPAISVTPDDTVRHCMELMTNGRFRHLPVVKSGRVVGMLSIGDLVKAVIEEQSLHIEQLERYIAG